MIQIELVAQNLISFSQDSLLFASLILFQSEMTSERELVIVKGPNMHIMYITDSLNLL